MTDNALFGGSLNNSAGLRGRASNGPATSLVGTWENGDADRGDDPPQGGEAAEEAQHPGEEGEQTRQGG